MSTKRIEKELIAEAVTKKTEEMLKLAKDDLQIEVDKAVERAIPQGIKPTVDDMLQGGVSAYGRFFPMDYFYDRIGIDVNVIEMRDDGSVVSSLSTTERLKRRQKEKEKFEWNMFNLRVEVQFRGYYLTEKATELQKHGRNPGEGYALLSQEDMEGQAARDIRKSVKRIRTTAIRTARVIQDGMSDSSRRRLDKQIESAAYYVGVLDRGRSDLNKYRKLQAAKEKKAALMNIQSPAQTP
jgi:hypothetical protein